MRNSIVGHFAEYLVNKLLLLVRGLVLFHGGFQFREQFSCCLFLNDFGPVLDLCVLIFIDALDPQFYEHIIRNSVIRS